ncbi:hypothetical protein GCM10020221_01590 [Streptomyces thioluteus]|uniref:Uncharacterized protein n=1 Tax=Streptomyces thioluteus TaxID=66431 RepID=A0ABN3WAU6_STRTU
MGLREDVLGHARGTVVPLPGIRTANLTLRSPTMTMPVHKLFPGLRRLHVFDNTSPYTGGLDLGILHGIPGLRVEVERVGTRPHVADAKRFGDRLTTTVMLPE